MLNLPSIVVGGGWAGLAAAYNLVKNQRPVILIEAAPKLGGRARAIQFGEHSIDNGQHVLLGAYQSIVQILSELGQVQAKPWPINWRMQSLNKNMQGLQLGLHALSQISANAKSLWQAQGLSRREKWQVMTFFLKYCYFDQLGADCTCLELFKSLKHSPSLLIKIWQPLVLAALSTPIEQASAKVFVNILRLSFASKKSASYLIPEQGLAEFFVNPLVDYLKAHQVPIYANHLVKELIYEDGKITGVKGQNFAFRGQVVLATPPWASAQLLNNIPAADTLCQDLQIFKKQMISTCYLEYPERINLGQALLGLIGSKSQWLFDRGYQNQDHILAVVITGAPGVEQSKAEVIALIQAELRAILPHLSKPTQIKLIQDKQAAYLCPPAIDKLRPNPVQSALGLYLCGDYMCQGLPASLEAAVQSGLLVSQLILNLPR